LAELRRSAAAQRTELTGLLGRVLSQTGEHDAAVAPLTEAYQRDPSDEAVLACLLRSEAAVRGTSAALDRYERYRAEVRDRLGVGPGGDVERVYRELLHLDRPVRAGLHYDASPLVGRAGDLRELRALVSTARVVSIVGAGGLGKTRLAHALGRSAQQPVVHFVELVGVTAPEDLIGEVGWALGVRDLVRGRRALTPQQRADARGRIAQQLAAAPSLLILDNCEHLVDAVAGLVAFLVATTVDLRVVTTTRAPLAISAEHVYPLGTLDRAQSVELFRQRAVAARPDVLLPGEAVADIVTRLDGLPLAIELAAGRARMMSVEEIRRRLADRFVLLRGGDRTAPDRHRTLLAVIDWSWNLLADSERRALRWLSVFQDGLSLGAAEVVLGPEALGVVQALVDQSLLTVVETGADVRYRMLETVREFGRLRLADAGEQDEAYAARRAWALRYALAAVDEMFGLGQFSAIDALAAEENNLADVLRGALAAADAETAMPLLSALGGLWSIRGEHSRVVALKGAVAEVVAGWDPPAELAEVTRAAMVIVVQNVFIGAAEASAGPARALLERLGVDPHGEPRINGMAAVLLALDPSRLDAFGDRLSELAESPDRSVAIAALQWHSYLLENIGDTAGAIVAAEDALALMREELDGPWPAAILHAQLAGLYIQDGRSAETVAHARAAIPVLERLGARDDLLQLDTVLVLSAIWAGRLDEAAAQLALARSRQEPDGISSGLLVLAGAELTLARGDAAAGLAAYHDAAERMRAVTFPGHAATGIEPWTMVADAGELTVLAHYGADDGEGPALFRSCWAKTRRLLGLSDPTLDYPVCGMALFALGSWGLLRSALPAAQAARLLVLAERFTYNRASPLMAWDRIAPRADEKAPGRIAALRAEYGDRRGPDLVTEAQHALDKTD
jgi:predicted ATPase